ncbi:hypothetical protein C0Q65_14590 [Streptomyces albidoflavus]|nr:hypothetical protein C0Q65_14590 [Streptomyces albidoflavus]
MPGCPRSKLHARPPSSNGPRTLQFVRRSPGAAPPDPTGERTANPIARPAIEAIFSSPAGA